MTKKQMIEDFPKVSQENDLLSLYLYDTQMGRKPDAVESEKQEDGRVRIQLWRASGAMGGYVVITNVGSNAAILSLDQANEHMRGHYDNYTLPRRLCLERLTAIRNKLAMGQSA
jgi:hypothetical protein